MFQFCLPKYDKKNCVSLEGNCGGNSNIAISTHVKAYRCNKVCVTQNYECIICSQNDGSMYTFGGVLPSPNDVRQPSRRSRALYKVCTCVFILCNICIICLVTLVNKHVSE